MGNFPPAGIVTIWAKYSHWRLPSKAGQLQIFNTSWCGRNGHQSPAVTLKKAEGKSQSCQHSLFIPVMSKTCLELQMTVCLKVTIYETVISFIFWTFVKTGLQKNFEQLFFKKKQTNPMTIGWFSYTQPTPGTHFHIYLSCLHSTLWSEL